MKIILKFNFNEKEYCIFEKNNTFQYGYIENNEIKTNLSSIDKDIINLVLYKIKPSNKRIFYNKIILNNTIYYIYIDPKTRLKSFEPKDNIKDLTILNNHYNNLSLNDYTTGNHRKKPNKFVKIMTSIGNSFITVMLLSSIAITTYLDIIYDKVYDMDYYQLLESQITYSISKNISTNPSNEEIKTLIEDALSRNKHLNEKEKNIILEHLEIFYDNKENIDFENVYINLVNMEIKYLNENVLEENPNIKATWDHSTMKMTIGNANSIDDIDIYIFTHEFCHAITKYNNMAKSITEALNSEVNSYYFAEDTSYYNVKRYMKALERIIGKEPLKKYYCIADINIIIDELTKIIDDKDKAICFLETLEDYYRLCYKNYISDHNNEKLKDQTSLTIKNYIKEYYTAKYNKDMSQDLLMSYYINNLSLEEKIRCALNLNPLININGLSSGEEIKLSRSNTFSNEKTKIYTRKTSYEVSGCDKDGNIIYTMIPGEYQYVCDLDDLEIDIEVFYENEIKYRNIMLKTDTYNNKYIYNCAIAKIVPIIDALNWISNSNDDIIIEELTKIIDNKSKAELLLKYIKEDQMNEFISLYKEFYTNKYNKNIEEDLYLLSIFNKTEFENLIREKYNLNKSTKILTKFTITNYNSDLEILYINDKIETIDNKRIYTIDSVKKIGLVSEIEDIIMNKGVVK